MSTFPPRIPAQPVPPSRVMTVKPYQMDITAPQSKVWKLTVRLSCEDEPRKVHFVFKEAVSVKKAIKHSLKYCEQVISPSDTILHFALDCIYAHLDQEA